MYWRGENLKNEVVRCALACNFSIWEIKAGGTGVRGHSWLHSTTSDPASTTTKAWGLGGGEAVCRMEAGGSPAQH